MTGRWGHPNVDRVRNLASLVTSVDVYILQQNFIILNLKGPALTARNKPYTFICFDRSTGHLSLFGKTGSSKYRSFAVI